MNLNVQLLGFESPSFHGSDLKLKQSRQIRLLHIIDKTMFIILYNHYQPKISEIKNQGLKLRFGIEIIIQQFVVKMIKVLQYLEVLLVWKESPVLL